MNGEVLGNALLVRRSNVAATHWHEFISHSTTEGSNRAAVRVLGLPRYGTSPDNWDRNVHCGLPPIYAVLWLLANYTSIGGGVLMLLIPLALLWLVACLAWVARVMLEVTRCSR